MAPLRNQTFAAEWPDSSLESGRMYDLDWLRWCRMITVRVHDGELTDTRALNVSILAPSVEIGILRKPDSHRRNRMIGRSPSVLGNGGGVGDRPESDPLLEALRIRHTQRL